MNAPKNVPGSPERGDVASIPYYRMAHCDIVGGSADVLWLLDPHALGGGQSMPHKGPDIGVGQSVYFHAEDRNRLYALRIESIHAVGADTFEVRGQSVSVPLRSDAMAFLRRVSGSKPYERPLTVRIRYDKSAGSLAERVVYNAEEPVNPFRDEHVDLPPVERPDTPYAAPTVVDEPAKTSEGILGALRRLFGRKE